jgi:hypothetical protein
VVRIYFSILLLFYLLFTPVSLDIAVPFNLPCSAFLKELVNMRGGQVIKIVLALFICH